MILEIKSKQWGKKSWEKNIGEFYFRILTLHTFIKSSIKKNTSSQMYCLKKLQDSQHKNGFEILKTIFNSQQKEQFSPLRKNRVKFKHMQMWYK